MTNIAYIRISDEYKQDSRTQKNAIKEYANKHSLIINKWVEEAVSGSKTDASDREISQVIAELKKRDVLICTEISRLGRNKPFSIISLINDITERHEAELHLAYTGQTITKENAENAEVLFTVVGASYAARQEAVKRAERAKAACNRRKSDGLSNGRPVGLYVTSKLDQYENEIVRALNDDASQSELARDYGVGRSTLVRWLALRNDLRKAAIDKGISQKASLSDIKAMLNKEKMQ